MPKFSIPANHAENCNRLKKACAIFGGLGFFTFLISLLVTFMVPNGMFTKHSNASTHIMIFFFMFKSLAAIVLFYGVALGKNFNSAIWNSKYFNA